MTSEFSDAPKESPTSISLRLEQEEDESFLLAVYASAREGELALTGWSQDVRRQFIEMQFKAMRQGYAATFSRAQFSIILLNGTPVGRVVVNRTDQEIRIVDMALLSAHRGKGIGTELMRIWCAESAQCGKPLRLRVVKETRPVNWYRRMGFTSIDDGDDGIHDHLEFTGEKIRAV